MAQRIRFASTAQRASDGENTHNRVSAGSEPQNDSKDPTDHGRSFISL
jgi:hypothetical protein